MIVPVLKDVFVLKTVVLYWQIAEIIESSVAKILRIDVNILLSKHIPTDMNYDTFDYVVKNVLNEHDQIRQSKRRSSYDKSTKERYYVAVAVKTA